MELSEFDIEYLPRMAIKGQAQANFMVEFTNFPETNTLPAKETWTVYVTDLPTKRTAEHDLW
jgi:hypothetical protein